MGKLNKSQINYIENRVNNVVRCTITTIEETYNKLKKEVPEYTDEEKLKLIKENKAKLKDDNYLKKKSPQYSDYFFESILKCYTYPKIKGTDKIIEDNKKLEGRKEEHILEVSRAGKRLIDRIVLGLIEDKDIPDELVSISNMVNL